MYEYSKEVSKNKSRNRKGHQWLSNELILYYIIRDKLYKKFRRNASEENKKNYKTFNNKLNKKIFKPKILFIPKNFYKTNTINVVRG